MTILLARRDKELRVDSFRSFEDVDSLAKFVKDHPKGLTDLWGLHPWHGWHAYRVYDDGTECTPLTLKEYQALGMRPSSSKRV